MSKGRMEAFTDGVLAIIITIMVLELRPPHEADWRALQELLPIILGYILSFLYVGIYWNNHHHLMQAAKTVNGRVLWMNMFLLFWLSLIPFATSWMGETHFRSHPVTLYGLVLLMAGVSYYLLEMALVAIHGKDSVLGRAVGEDIKGRISLVVYIVAVLVAQVSPLVACALFVLVALMWLIPDQRIEKALTGK